MTSVGQNDGLETSCGKCLKHDRNNLYVCVCVFVALGIQHAMCLRNIIICGLPRSTIFYHFISKKRHDFRKKKVIE